MGARLARPPPAFGHGEIAPLHFWREPIAIVVERFVEMFNRATGCACFMEYSDASVDKFSKPFEEMFTKGRHHGHRMFAIAQRHTQISPLIRDQWDAFWLFSCGIKTAAISSEEFGDDAIREAATYPHYRYLLKRRCMPILAEGPPRDIHPLR